jgi:hypothetical protein
MRVPQVREECRFGTIHGVVMTHAIGERNPARINLPDPRLEDTVATARCGA